MEMTVEELLKIMKQFFENVSNELKSLQDELVEVEKEQQDLLHYIEANNLNAGKYAKVGKLLKEVRIKRRAIKNNIERIEHIKKFSDKYNNKLITGDLVQTIKGLKTIAKRQQNPVYVRRTDIIQKMEETETNE